MSFLPTAARASAVLLVLAGATSLTASADTDILVYPGACRDVDAMDADAWGEAVGLVVRYNGEELVGPLSEAAQSQDGPGMSDDDQVFEEVAVPPGENAIVRAKLLHSRVDLKVERDPLESQAWSQATVLELDILDGRITADTVKAFAYARADIHGAGTKTDPSRIEGLRIDGAVTDSSPGAHIALPQGVLGVGSFIATYVREEASRFPGNGSILFEGDTTVTMLHAYLADVDLSEPGLQTLEVIVSRAHAHAEAPTPFCGLVQSVASGAYAARVRPQVGSDTSVLVGRQDIGVVGGSARQQLLGQEVFTGEDSLLELNVSETRVDGSVLPNGHSESKAVSKVLGLCVDQRGEEVEDPDPDYNDCFILATAIRAESNSYADAEKAISWGSVTLVGLRVAGVDVCARLGYGEDGNQETYNGSFPQSGEDPNVCKPKKNTRIDLGVVNVTLNERQRDEERPGHTGYYVRAVRIQGPIVGDIILSRAYTSADYFDPAG